jgi:crotonobetainyl-CoA:carnitine CoA-transferase CaiB-like acyl-CoA transferase
MVMGGPLSGVSVLELGSGLGGLAAGALLAQLGAEVVQAVIPGAPEPTDPVRIWADHLKERLTADRGPRASTVEVRRRADAADVVLSDLPPGSLERIGLDAATVLQRNPYAIHAWLPAFGTAGRWSHLRFDPLLLSAVSGFADHYPSDQNQPIAPAVPTLGYLQGAMGAAAAVAGLVGRQRDGSGRSVIVTGLHAAVAALATLMTRGIDVDKVISPGRSLRGAPYFRLYQGSDGEWFYVAALSPSIFFRALDAIGRMDVMVRDDVAGEFANLVVPEVSYAVNTELERTFETRPAESWLQILRAAEVPVAPVWSRQAWSLSEMSSATAGWTEFDQAGVGVVRAPAGPISLDRGSAPGPTLAGPISLDLGSAPTPDPAVVDPIGPDANRRLPLSGLRVVDVSSYLAAPFAGALLANYGADVVKVEPGDGDPYRVHSISHAVANQHKRFAALDLRDGRARDALLQLVSRSDVLVDNAREGSLARLGLTEGAIHECNAALVRCSVSAFGTANPWSAMPGFDPVLQSMTGLAAAQGGAGRPSPSTAPVVDIATGSLAALGILAALYRRGLDGAGGHVRTSLAAGAVFLQSAEMTTYRSRPAIQTGCEEFAGPAVDQRYYRTCDGWLAVSARTDSERGAFRELRWLPSPSGGQGEPDVEALALLIATEPTIDMIDRLTAEGIPAAEVLLRPDAISDAYLAANGVTTVLELPDLGRFRVARSYSEWSGTESPAGRAGRIGADTAEVLHEAGIDDAWLAELVTRGAAVVEPGMAP